MATEVEIKAWVENPDALRTFLRERSEYRGSFVKEDTYFCRRSGGGTADSAAVVTDRDVAVSDRDAASDGTAAERPLSETALFRLRIQNGTAIVTYKEKSLDGGTEINREHEFTVSDVDAFAAFVEGVGFSPCVRKRKEGEVFRWGETNVELSFVETLGWFVEIERIVETGPGVTRGPEDAEMVAAAVEEAKGTIHALLDRMGIGSDKIEKRYYVDML